MYTIPAFFPGAPGLPEMLILAIIALLLFGKKLPQVARDLGKGIVEFKKGVHGIEDEVKQATYSSPSSSSRPVPDEVRDEVTAPKFEPPVSEPSETRTAQAEEQHQTEGQQS